MITIGWAGGGGQKETVMSELTHPRAGITKFGRYKATIKACCLFVPNFVTAFRSEDLQSEGHVRQPPLETALVESFVMCRE